MTGVKAVDFLAVHRSTTWLIELKDYRRNRRTKAIDIADEVALKIRDSLAVLVAAAMNANDPAEKKSARRAISASLIRIVLHLEQPRVRSKLFPIAIDRAKVQQSLKQLVGSVDAHPQVVDMAHRGNVPWSVE